MEILSKHKVVSLSLAILLMTHAVGQHSHRPAVNNVEKNTFLLIMDTMMIKMADVSKSIYTNEIFIRMMIPHHEGAIEMAAYEIRFGNNAALRQLAKSIFNEQQVEVQQMKLWLNDYGVDTIKASTCFLKNMDISMTVMMQNMPTVNMPNNIDYAFARIMIPHHQAAIDMARAIIQNGTDIRMGLFAVRIIASQQIEIEQMQLFLNQQKL